MARYCKSCGSTQIPLFIAFIAVFFGKISVFVILHCTDIHNIPTDTPDHFTPLRACAARGKKVYSKCINFR